MNSDHSMILILTEDTDSSATDVERLLERRGAPFLRFNPARFPGEASLTADYSENGLPLGVLETGGTRYRLEDFGAVWERRPQKPLCPDAITRGISRRFVKQECERFAEDFWQLLECRWLPAPAPVIRRIHKVGQLKLALELGFEMPPTLITNDPEEFLDFHRTHNGRIIGKVFFNGTMRPEAPHEVLSWTYTEIVSSRATAYASSIRHSPVIFQAYVPKRSELRVTVVGRQVFAAEIFSQKNNRSRRDWRRYDLGHTPHAAHRLPDNVEHRCVELVERFGLTYGTIDLILTPDGRYVFLEINPNGQWQWIESLTGLPISQAVCDFLVDGPTPPHKQTWRDSWKGTSIPVLWPAA